jgi:hypothetical protein
MEADPTKAYNQDDATGFIRLNALRLKVAAKVHWKKVPRSGFIRCPPICKPLITNAHFCDFGLMKPLLIKAD